MKIQRTAVLRVYLRGRNGVFDAPELEVISLRNPGPRKASAQVTQPRFVNCEDPDNHRLFFLFFFFRSSARSLALLRCPVSPLVLN